jgi:hypothetical protein
LAHPCILSQKERAQVARSALGELPRRDGTNGGRAVRCHAPMVTIT